MVLTSNIGIRELKTIRVNPLEVQINGRINKCYNEDANELIKRIKADIIY